MPYIMQSHLALIQSLPQRTGIAQQEVSGPGLPVFDRNGFFVGLAATSFGQSYLQFSRQVRGAAVLLVNVEESSAFYYRVHSPVLLIEFDHQRGIVFDNDAASRQHIHTVVRTPNGNDYGRDLLRQHHEQVDHGRADHRHR